MAAVSNAYPISDDLLDFIRDEIPNSLKNDVKKALADEADMHKDLKNNFNDLKAELTGD